MVRWLRSLFAWELKHFTGVWAYYENAITGRRKAIRRGPFYNGYQPQNIQWLNGGEWEMRRPSPPAGMAVSCVHKPTK